MRQKNIFLEDEGDRWFERNRHQMARNARDAAVDPVIASIEAVGIKPTRVLEIGCADGWRLAALRDKYDCDIMGVEPSRQACIEAAERRVPVVQGTASCPAVSTPFQFDLVIYGFCLYLADPTDWLQIAAEGNTALSDDGYLIIHDFRAFGAPTARKYEHRDGVLSYHLDFAKLWLGNPLYSVVTRASTDDDQMVTVLKKSPVGSIRVLP